MNDEGGTLSDLWREERDACMMKEGGKVGVEERGLLGLLGLLGNLFVVLEGERRHRRPFIASIQTSQLDCDGGRRADGLDSKAVLRSSGVCDQGARPQCVAM
jgi:hypothetical protein